MTRSLLFCLIIFTFSTNLSAQSPFGKSLNLNRQQQYIEIPDREYH